ncbi:PHD finger protein [Musa troglodytarum]|uniref:PHD finger protein ALFIN-LIKE n=1 Tax=Musa troglodytarum TaxID=320322 RepID=A0A9E7GJ69_9LILI|nr:PHD finger protein [Musa troglodytarum]
MVAEETTDDNSDSGGSCTVVAVDDNVVDGGSFRGVHRWRRKLWSSLSTVEGATHGSKDGERKLRMKAKPLNTFVGDRGSLAWKFHSPNDYFANLSWHSKKYLIPLHNHRKRLFSMINELPTVFEVVSDRRQSKEKSSMDGASKSKLSTKRSSDGQIKSNSRTADEGYGEEEDEHSETLCGTCGGSYSADEFWIACDVCERWFHGKCVKITPAKAESIKQYKCPSCSSKKGRQ